MRSESTSAFGQPRLTKPTRPPGAAGFGLEMTDIRGAATGQRRRIIVARARPPASVGSIPHTDLQEHPREPLDRPGNLSLIHISEPTRLLSSSYAVFCLKKKNCKFNY